MSHRAEEKESRRAERLRQEEAARHAEARQRLMRRSGFGAVGAIAIVLVAIAVAGGSGSGAAPADHMAGAAGTAVVGHRAPDFALTDVVSNRLYGLGALKGHKTLLFFSEGVGCQACMVQASDLQRVKALTDRGIDVVSVTTDNPGDLAQAARQYGIRTPLLADPTMSMSKAYGMLGHGGMGHPTQDGHAFMLLDAGGKVLWHQGYQEMYVKPSQLLSDMGGVA
jgi:peroxiredoxin